MKRSLLTLADKISKLDVDEVNMINGYLKLLKSTWRIKETDSEQLRKLGESGKKLLEKIGVIT